MQLHAPGIYACICQLIILFFVFHFYIFLPLNINLHNFIRIAHTVYSVPERKMYFVHDHEKLKKMKVIPMAEEEVKLRSVRHLHLKTQLHVQEYYGITYFLKSCPMLEVLTIDLGRCRRILQVNVRHLKLVYTTSA